MQMPQKSYLKSHLYSSCSWFGIQRMALIDMEDASFIAQDGFVLVSNQEIWTRVVMIECETARAHDAKLSGNLH